MVSGAYIQGGAAEGEVHAKRLGRRRRQREGEVERKNSGGLLSLGPSIQGGAVHVSTSIGGGAGKRDGTDHGDASEPAAGQRREGGVRGRRDGGVCDVVSQELSAQQDEETDTAISAGRGGRTAGLLSVVGRTVCSSTANGNEGSSGVVRLYLGAEERRGVGRRRR